MIHELRFDKNLSLVHVAEAVHDFRRMYHAEPYELCVCQLEELDAYQITFQIPAISEHGHFIARWKIKIDKTLLPNQWYFSV